MASSVQSGGAIIFFVCLGTWLSATVLSSGIATGVSDRFAAQGELKAQGEPFEQQSYLEAESTRVTERALHRDVDAYQTNEASRDLFSVAWHHQGERRQRRLAESGIVLEILRTSAGCAGQGRPRRARSDH
jgi:hypothetical protein